MKICQLCLQASADDADTCANDGEATWGPIYADPTPPPADPPPDPPPAPKKGGAK